MRNLGSVLVALLAGVSLGILLGLFIGSRGGTTALAAGIGLVVAIVAPLLTYGLSQFSERQKSRAEQVIRDRARYGQHADELNSHVFAPSASAALTPKSIPYPNDEPLSRGIQSTRPSLTGPISGLPNWPHGLSHMLADEPVKEAWSRANQAATSYLAALDRAMHLLLGRLDGEISEAYGPEMYLRRSRQDADRLTWCDTPQLALVLLDQRSNGSVRTFERSLSPEEQRGEPRLPSSGGMVTSRGNVFIMGRTAGETDPAPLRRIYIGALTDPGVLAVLDATITAEQEAKSRIAEFAEVTRQYSNEILTSHTFAGRCKVCRDYLLE